MTTVIQIDKAIHDLSTLLIGDDNDGVLLDTLYEDYPFQESLDDLSIKVTKWRKSVKDVIEKALEEEKTIPVTYGIIKARVGWSRFCDVTGGNHYAINDHGEPNDRQLYEVTLKHAKKLGII